METRFPTEPGAERALRQSLGLDQPELACGRHFLHAALEIGKYCQRRNTDTTLAAEYFLGKTEGYFTALFREGHVASVIGDFETFLHYVLEERSDDREAGR